MIYLEPYVQMGYNILVVRSPIRTGNLRYNSLNIKQIEPNHYVIYIDGNIAPYAVFTNEKWVSPHWHGKSNPNEGWINRAVDYFVYELARNLNGTVTVTGWEARQFNRSYWEKVQRGEIIRNDNITGIE